MEFLDNHWEELFGIFLAISGLVGFVRSKISIGLGDSDESNNSDDYYWTVEGPIARVLSVGYVAAGTSFFLAGPILGFPILIALVVLTWALGRSAT